MENNKALDLNNQDNNAEEQDVENIIESKTIEEDYQFTERGFKPDKKRCLIIGLKRF